ncbi:hypothetical protein BDW_06435 [Bdellovibrio bacteriovorus W]|nr:hypothetical protein BDW_06435 [Bdellovibrio bacteriovorus W]
MDDFFADLILKVESSEEITNQGKDGSGFYKPTRTIVLRHLNLLKDLHAKPLAKEMLRSSWSAVVEILPPEWLILSKEDGDALRKALKD